MKLIVFLITGLGFISCKSTYPVYKQLIDREIKHYGVNFKDTILDLGQDQMFMDELTSTFSTMPCRAHAGAKAPRWSWLICCASRAP